MEVLLERYPGLRGLPHVDLGVRPTPVEDHRIEGLRVLVKRDDRTSALYGGNKPRSLEFLLAPRPGHVLTYSSLSAHHAYATAVCARHLGLPCTTIIVRKGRRGPLLDTLPATGAHVVEVGGVLGAAAATVRYRRSGTRIIPPGGMSARGALGYVVAALELETVPARIYAPVGSGTTVSGLLAGLMLRGAATEVVGVRVADAVASFRPWLWRRAFGALRILRRQNPGVPRVNRGRVRLRIVKAGGRYGEPTPAAEEALAAASAAGLCLEATYTGKTLAVLLAERATDALFLNTYAGPPAGPAGPVSPPPSA